MLISKIVNLMKNYTTYHIWKDIWIESIEIFLERAYFWTDGYFVQCRKCFKKRCLENI